MTNSKIILEKYLFLSQSFLSVKQAVLQIDEVCVYLKRKMEMMTSRLRVTVSREMEDSTI